MLIEQEKRDARVRFKHPIRVVTLDGQPRVIRTLTANVSKRGCFVRMPEPLPKGTRVALSLEAGGRALAFAEAIVVWGRAHESQWPGRFSGCGVRFTDYLHPRAPELVTYLVSNLDRGRPLKLAPPPRRGRWPVVAAAAALVACAAAATWVLWPASPRAPSDAVELGGAPLKEATQRAVAPAEGQGPSLAQGAVLEENAPSSPTEGQAVAPAEGQVPPSPPQLDGPAQRSDSAVSAAQAVELSEGRAEQHRSPGAPRPPEENAPPAQPQPEDARPESEARAQLTAALPAPSAGAGPMTVTSTPADRSSGEDPAPRQLAGRPASRGRAGSLELPTGAAPSLSWSLEASTLRLSVPNATIARAFVLAHPARAVIDLVGDAPDRSRTLATEVPHATSVRLGKTPEGTRVVVDLASAPVRTSQSGDELLLSF